MTAVITNESGIDGSNPDDPKPADQRPGDEVMARIARVPRPQPVMSRETYAALSDRQREILDRVGLLFADGFNHLTMAEIASSLNCSLRTLYTVAKSREDLVLIVVDRNLWAIGRAARDAIVPDMQPLDAIRSYLRAASVSVASITEAFANDTDSTPAAQALHSAHNSYLASVTQALLNEAVRSGAIARCDTGAVSKIIAGLGRQFSRADVISTLRSSPKKAADDMVDVILLGLQARQ